MAVRCPLSFPSSVNGIGIFFLSGDFFLRTTFTRKNVGRARRMTLRTTFCLGLLAVLLVAGVAVAKKQKPSAAPDQRERATHALDRLTFGPRPGDIDAVISMGVDKWVDLQLHPDRIDDTAIAGTALGISHAANELARDGPRVSVQCHRQGSDGRQASDATRSL